MARVVILFPELTDAYVAKKLSISRKTVRFIRTQLEQNNVFKDILVSSEYIFYTIKREEFHRLGSIRHDYVKSIPYYKRDTLKLSQVAKITETRDKLLKELYKTTKLLEAWIYDYL